jgi:hypothetical protein
MGKKGNARQGLRQRRGQANAGSRTRQGLRKSRGQARQGMDLRNARKVRQGQGKARKAGAKEREGKHSSRLGKA